MTRHCITSTLGCQPRSLADVLQQARVLFPATTGDPDTTPVISHARWRSNSCKRDGEVTLVSGVGLTASQAVRQLRLSYALISAGCQGLALTSIVRLDCTDSAHFTERHMYVGSSRCTANTLLEKLEPLCSAGQAHQS